MGKKGRFKQQNQAGGTQVPVWEQKKEEGNNQAQGGGEKKQENEKKEPKDLIILKVHIHCGGCADKVTKCLRGFEGVEDVNVNAKENKVIVKGKNADPLKIVERVRKKCNKHVELISPKPKPSDNKAKAKAKEDDDNEPLVMIVVLKVYIHCENCAQEIKRSIEKMKGVQMVEPDLKTSQMTVTGAIDPPKLVDFLYKRAGKHAVIVKEEYQDKEKAKRRLAKQHKKGDQKEDDGGTKKEEKIKDVYYHYPPQYSVDYVYPCQMFNDENANACSIM